MVNERLIARLPAALLACTLLGCGEETELSQLLDPIREHATWDVRYSAHYEFKEDPMLTDRLRSRGAKGKVATSRLRHREATGVLIRLESDSAAPTPEAMCDHMRERSATRERGEVKESTIMPVTVSARPGARCSWRIDTIKRQVLGAEALVLKDETSQTLWYIEYEIERPSSRTDDMAAARNEAIAALQSVRLYATPPQPRGLAPQR